MYGVQLLSAWNGNEEWEIYSILLEFLSSAKILDILQEFFKTTCLFCIPAELQ